MLRTSETPLSEVSSCMHSIEHAQKECPIHSRKLFQALVCTECLSTEEFSQEVEMRNSWDFREQKVLWELSILRIKLDSKRSA